MLEAVHMLGFIFKIYILTNYIDLSDWWGPARGVEDGKQFMNGFAH